MRTMTIALAVAAGFAATPVLACPMMNQAAAKTTTTATASPMMCGAQPTATQAQAAQPAQPGQSTPTGGCPCCRDMAMMQPQPNQPGGMGNMPGMNMTPSPNTPAPATPAPETPRP